MPFSETIRAGRGSSRHVAWCIGTIIPFVAVLLASTAFMPVLAEELRQPEGPVILEIGGRIENTNAPGVARFDAAMLDALPQTSVITYTDWTSGRQNFTGVRLDELLAHVGASGTKLTAAALNDYQAKLPASDAADHDVLLATRNNGEPMPIRDKGPIWIIYPSAEPSADLPQPHNDKMVWQLHALTVE